MKHGNEPPRSRPKSSRPDPGRQIPASEASFVSPTPSVDADDEDSSIDRRGSEMDEPMQDDQEERYEGEDTRLTSRKELAGWYSYGWAAEVFAICAMGSFLPITLEQLARDQGVLLTDKTTPCRKNGHTHLNATVKPYINTRSHRPHHGELPACVIYFLGAEINTASFAMYTFSLSVLAQALLIISMSGAADHGRFRKSFLLAFAFTGAVSLMLFLPVVPKVYVLGALLAIITNTCFGASFVLLNSFLPLLVRHHPSVQHPEWVGEPHLIPNDISDSSENHIDIDDANESVLMDSSAALLPGGYTDHTLPVAPPPAATSQQLTLSTRISSNGIGIGYIAGVLVQSTAVLIVLGLGSTTFSLRLVLFLIGVWWFVFTIPGALWLRPRPGPPLPASMASKQNWISYLTYAWKSLGKTVKRARRLRDVLLFLGAWFLLSDGIATVSGTAVLFAKTQLGMPPAALALINVIATIAGVVGAFSWGFISRLLNLRASQTIVACICLFEVIPLYGLLGFIPAVQGMGVLGLQQPWEMYPLGAIYGFVLGGLSSYCRSFFGELIPPGFEAAFYALYAITDKGSSIFGPAIVGAITDRYGEIRPAFVFLAVLISLPLPLMLLVDVDRGKADAAAMAVELGGKGKDLEYHSRHENIPTINLISEQG